MENTSIISQQKLSHLNVNDLSKVVDFYKDRSDDYEGLIGRISGTIHYPALFNLMKYGYLIKYLYSDKMYRIKIFHHLCDAILEMNDIKTLIYIEELGLYFLHDNSCFSNRLIHMISDLSKAEYNNLNTRMFTFYEIIPTDKKHKLAFLAKGSEDNIKKVCEYCEQLYKTTVNTYVVDDWTRIVVRALVMSYSHSVSLVNMIYDTMRNNISDKSLSELDIRPLQKNIVEDNAFVMINLDIDLAYKPQIDSIMDEVLIRGQGDYALLMQSRLISNEANEYLSTIDLDPIVSARVWILNNLPPTSTPSVEYYNKYKTNHSVHIPVASFNELMYPHGYTLKRKVWIK